MQEQYVLENLQTTCDKEEVMRLLDCNETSPIYEEMEEEYETLRPEMERLAEPVGIIGFGVLPEFEEPCNYPAGTKVIYVVTSIGDGIKHRSQEAFAQGDYVQGMICDAIADSLLFSMEDQVQEALKRICGNHGVGIAKRMEAPHDLPMEVQKTAWEALQLEAHFGIRISSGFMFDPVKTSCQVYVTTEDSALFRAQHDCSTCPNVTCRMRKA